MNKYAIIQLAGKQFKVSEGETIIVEKELTEDKTLKVTDVLMVSDGKDVTVGTPTVEGASVSLEITDKGKGPKISVRTYRSKSRYRRHLGHRQPQTALKVVKIA